MAVSGASNSTGVNPFLLMWTSVSGHFYSFLHSKDGKKELGNQYVKCQPHGTLIFWIYLFVPLEISFIWHLAPLLIQPYVLGFQMLSVFEQTGNMSNMIYDWSCHYFPSVWIYDLMVTLIPREYFKLNWFTPFFFVPIFLIILSLVPRHLTTKSSLLAHIKVNY